MQGWFILKASAVAIAATCVAASSAAAAPSPPFTSSTASGSSDSAHIVYAQRIAADPTESDGEMGDLRTPGASPESGWITTFDLFSQELREQYPDDFAESRLVLDKDAGSISFKGAIPIGISERASSVGHVTLVGNVGYTEAELEETSQQLVQAASEQIGEDATIASYFDSADNGLHVEYAFNTHDSSRAVSPSPVDPTALETDLVAAVSIPVGIPLTVNFVATPVEEITEASNAGYNLVR